MLPGCQERHLCLDVSAIHLELVILGMGKDVVDFLDESLDLGTAQRGGAPALDHEFGNPLVVWCCLVELENQLAALAGSFLTPLDIILNILLVANLGAIELRRLDGVDLLEDLGGWPIGPESQGR